MEKIEVGAVIKYFFIKGLSSTEMKAESDATLGKSAHSFTAVKMWVADFKHDSMST